MHVEICDVSCVLVKTVKTQKQIKYKKKILTLNPEHLSCSLKSVAEFLSLIPAGQSDPHVVSLESGMTDQGKAKVT